MPIAVSCQCGKTLNVRDDLAGKAVKCPGCQTVLRVPAIAAKGPAVQVPAQGPKVAPRPAPPALGMTKPAAPVVAKLAPASANAAARESATMDSFYSEAGFDVKVGKFCPECTEALLPGAVLCTRCGYHLESGAKLDAYRSEIEAPDSVNAVLRKAELNMQRDKELQIRLENAGMPAWMMAMGLFILASCTTVGVIAVNVSRRSKDDTVSFNAVATMLLLAGIAFSAVAIGSYCTVLYRAFQDKPKQGMFVLLIPGYVIYYAFTHFKLVGKAFIVFLLTLGAAVGLFVLSGMSNAGQL